MKNAIQKLSFSIVASLLVSLPAFAQQLPVIKSGQLLVDGKPYLVMGGELHNSSASDPGYMAPIWDKLQAMHVRTVIGTASWEDCEPTEGTFNFAAVDAQIQEARKRDMRLVMIWFGAFKNASSTYAPSWVRADPKRFPRAVVEGHLKEAFTYSGAMPKPVLSVFSSHLFQADQAAFVALMQHLRQVDTDHRVVMVQVNNETGLLGDSRDRSALADDAWNKPVPQQLLQYLAEHRPTLKPELLSVWGRQGYRTKGSWAEVFGSDWQGEEVFMAWHFGQYVNTLAAAGKKALDIPMYANAWLGPQNGQPTAGLYPSGGPASRVLDVWRAAAPSLDLFAPDIYVSDAKEVMAEYHEKDNPLFVPEAQFRTGDMFWAFGQDAAIGYSIFGIEDGRIDGQLSQAFEVLGPMTEMIAAAQAQGRIAGILLDNGQQHEIHLDGYTLTVRETAEVLKQMMLDAGLKAPPAQPPLPSETEGPSSRPISGDIRPFGLVIAEGHGSFLIVGKGFNVDFGSGSKLDELDRVEEGRVEMDGWHKGRTINGDERLNIIPVDHIGVVRVHLLQPKVP